ncbi:MAG: YfcE family phosphodiesterase [Candidatus Hodarchaeota archaeon]
MAKYLAIGDSHIPRRAKSIPEKIITKLKELTKNELFDYTFFTGDIINAPEFIDFLTQRTKKKFFIVIGNMDFYGGNKNAPVYEECEILFNDGEKMTIGLTHGAQISPRGDHSQLEEIAIERKYNIIISSHSHQEEIFLTKRKILLINPGSITGAWSFVASGIHSFIVLKIIEKIKEIQVKLYQLKKSSNDLSELKSYFIFKNNRINYKF